MDPGLSLDIDSWTPNLPDHREQKRFVCVRRSHSIPRGCVFFYPWTHASRYGSVFRKGFLEYRVACPGSWKDGM